jgi:hypothetical protein
MNLTGGLEVGLLARLVPPSPSARRRRSRTQFAFRSSRHPIVLSESSELSADPPADSRLLAPVTQAPGLAVTNWDNSMKPAVNGAPIKLEHYEYARSLAIVRGTQHFVLGSEWSVHLLDRLGHEVWPAAQSAPDAAWTVNATGDGS